MRPRIIFSIFPLLFYQFLTKISGAINYIFWQEEWVVCRVFQKSAAMKKPQQAASSRDPSIESPCDDANSIANEFGDIELPNLNAIANSSSSGFLNNNNNIISTQGFLTNNNMMSLNNMNWTNINSLPPLSSWPSNMLSPNLSMNSFLLKALQLRNSTSAYTQPSTDNYSYNMPQGVSHFGTDIHDLNTTANFKLGSSSSSSKMMNSSKIVDSASQVQQQEQPFNLDSVW